MTEAPDLAKSRRLYAEGKASVCDIYDVSGLTATSGPAFTGVLASAKNDIDRMTKYTGFSTVYGSANALAQAIRDMAGHGATPLGSLSIGGHADAFAAGRMGDAGTGAFNQSSLWAVSEVKRQPDYDKAREKKGPPPCWFVNGATVRLLGCKSRQVAVDLAAQILHPKSKAFGTTETFNINPAGTLGWFENGRGTPISKLANYAGILQEPQWAPYSGRV